MPKERVKKPDILAKKAIEKEIKKVIAIAKADKAEEDKVAKAKKVKENKVANVNKALEDKAIKNLSIRTERVQAQKYKMTL